ncbi:MAG: chemotaxis protein CheW [Actinobacteria bacterium]|nr:chemotaxis protein CheW [Actinomycetota bacterium]
MSDVHVHVRVAGEHYALPVERVLEVAELDTIAAVPGAPPEILGVRNLRGQVLPVVALAAVLGLPGGDPTRVVVVESGELHAGLRVDEVLDVEELPPRSEAVESNLLSGACMVDGELVGVLDVDAVLSSIAVR